MARVITVTSGKGGVGKTNISVNMAVGMAMEGIRPCLFDADLGLANINILLGMRPEFDLADVISGEKSLSEIIIHDPSGIDVVPGGTGIEKLAQLDTASLTSLAESFSRLDGYDVLIFDTSAGISREVLSFCMASREIVLVIVPEPTSLTDAFSLLKVLSLNGYRDPVKVVVNQAKHERLGQVVFNKFYETVQKYFALPLLYIGDLPADESIAEAVTRQRPFITLYPDGRAAMGMKRVVRRLMVPDAVRDDDKRPSSFWDNYSRIVSAPMQMPHNKTKINPKASSSETTRPAVSSESEKVSSEALVSRRILESLDRLLSTTTGISRELNEFRKVIDKLAGASASSGNVSGLGTSSQLPPVVALDFEAYVKRKRGNTDKEK